MNEPVAVENAMKKCLRGLLVPASIAVILNAGCGTNESPMVTASGSDTLVTTIVQHDTIHKPGSLYRLITQKSTDDFDTIYSDTAPPTATPLLFGSIGNCGFFHHSNPGILFMATFDTLYRFIDNPVSQDTVFIFHTLDSSQVLYHDTIDCRVDTIEAFRKSHKPYFDNKDSIAALLGTVTEGLRQYIEVSAFHFDDDSATIKLVDAPSWAHLEWINVSEKYGDCWFYPKCVNGVLVFSACPHAIAKKAGLTGDYYDCSSPYVVVAPDSTAPGSTWRWKVVMTNKYALSDTISVTSSVTPFPYNCP